MAEIIRMPRMSDTMEEGNIIGWLKKVGDKVEPGETLAEVETDKATMELDAFVEGTLLYIAVPEGTVAIDGIIAVIGQPGEDWRAAINGSGSAGSSPSIATANPENDPVQQENIPTSIVSGSNDGHRIKASPLAKSMAKESGINLEQIQGSGEGGRIVRKDVIGVKPGDTVVPTVTKNTVAPTQVVSSQNNATDSTYEDKMVSQMRKTIARRLSESKFTAPHFYLSVEIDMERAMVVREQLNQNSDVRISYNDLVIRSVASALKKHPVINASWLGDRIRYNHDVHIGVAVAVEDGLLVPVIKYADRKTLSQINGEVKMLAGKAKDKKLQPDEMQGNTFTISNLGHVWHRGIYRYNKSARCVYFSRWRHNRKASS